jgi:GNAT superfamily N-acetyltransferase
VLMLASNQIDRRAVRKIRIFSVYYTVRVKPERKIELEITYINTTFEDADTLVEIRISAMKESLERIGRFNPQRARERFIYSFEPVHTKYIALDGSIVGFVAVKFEENEVLLDHLYITPEHQSKGIGAVVLQRVFSEANLKSLPVKVGALRESASNRFYQRHGFIKSGESEWDIYYVRQPEEKL